MLLIVALSQTRLVAGNSDRKITLQTEGEWHNLDRIAALKEENNTQFAVKNWEALVSTWDLHAGSFNPYQAPRPMVYTNPIIVCLRAGNVDLAIRFFAHLEHSQDGKLHVGIFQHLLKTYVAVGDI